VLKLINLVIWMEDEKLFILGILTVFLIILAYVIGGSFLEKVKSPLFHETGIAIVIGFTISLVAYLIDDDKFNDFFKFNTDLFFYILLPPILFASGFNMRRKKFFQNIGYILLFGVFGTLVCFGVFTLLNLLLMKLNFMWQYNGETKEYTPFTLDILPIMLISSLLCSSDVIAAMCLIKFEE
jgi:NhaP-type Na+/H+ or K+/H+ antiporter